MTTGILLDCMTSNTGKLESLTANASRGRRRANTCRHTAASRSIAGNVCRTSNAPIVVIDAPSSWMKRIGGNLRRAPQFPSLRNPAPINLLDDLSFDIYL